jgi:hypothetical protein
MGDSFLPPPNWRRFFWGVLEIAMYYVSPLFKVCYGGDPGIKCGLFGPRVAQLSQATATSAMI